MGKAGRWLRHFLPSGRKDRGNKDKPLVPVPEPDHHHQASTAWALTTGTTTTTPASTPGGKEKRRWSFRRPAVASPGSAGKECKDGGRGVAYGGFLVEPRVDPDHHAVAVAIATAAAAEAAMVAKHAAAAAFRLSASSQQGSKRAVVGIEDAAAIKIQAVFRSYLARKALCALRGLVKLQALVRGHLVRRQASHTLRCMQALVAAQNRARVARLRLLEQDDDDDSNKQPPVVLHRNNTPRTTPTRRSPHHPRFRHHHHQEAEENVKIVEVDTGGEAQYATPRTTASRRSSCYATPLCRTPCKNDLYHHHQKTISPTPSALTDASARSLSGRYDDFSFGTARNSPYHHHYDLSSSRPHQQQHPLLAVPSYMANTESSRAKARSQSAPRQRHSVSSSSSAAAAVEVPWERQGSGRRRASLEGQAARGMARVQRCPSQASAPAWGGARVVADRWAASAQDSECGSTSTVMTAATTTYCWSMATDNAGVV
ncbi:hypothetical protein PR202_gb11694 [Eleusine coracana subsp. coracana]|uniref:DUF4005 domain-containing protein n=1 Tax=Eleusine coracana subsp. coracana TaxID=191504 RepID=A0AAV5EMV4_ELECO|nr:hypothetical protein QOZ80_3BG0270130 [Eleusine coracana subsp. coracana]GJN23990.1 hypothetical protein PR202_gb11694 [Eleusine coracana subsp. coracana]